MTANARFALALCATFMVSAAISGGALYRGLLRQDCGLQATQARAMVVEDLRDRGLPVRALAPAPAEDACRYVFRYAGDGRATEYAVHSDWRRGAVVARREPAEGR